LSRTLSRSVPVRRHVWQRPVHGHCRLHPGPDRRAGHGVVFQGWAEGRDIDDQRLLRYRVPLLFAGSRCRRHAAHRPNAHLADHRGAVLLRPRGRDSDTHANTDPESDTYRHANPDAHAESDKDAAEPQAHQDADTDTEANDEADSDSYADPNTDSDAQCHCSADRTCHAEPFPDADTDAQRGADNPIPAAERHRDADAHPHCLLGALTVGKARNDAHPDAHA
jgi:hypothetical protein